MEAPVIRVFLCAELQLIVHLHTPIFLLPFFGAVRDFRPAFTKTLYRQSIGRDTFATQIIDHGSGSFQR
jgi:hypothetical protein